MERVERKSRRIRPAPQLRRRGALVVTATAIQAAKHGPAGAFLSPSAAFSPRAAPCRIKRPTHWQHCSSEVLGVDFPSDDDRWSRPRRRRRGGRLGMASGGVFEWGDGMEEPGSGKRKPLRTRASGPNGAGEVSSSVKDASRDDQKQAAEFTISALLSAITPDFGGSPSVGASKGGMLAGVDASSSMDGGEEGECEDFDTKVAGGTARTTAAASDVSVEVPAAAQNEEVTSLEGDGEGDGEGREEGEGDAGGGTAQERGRRRDMYKIRSLLLQGQIAGLRERLKERELDVKELRVLTGGRGHTRLRELGALLKEARAERDALRAREKALAQELALSQKEGDTLRGDLLANQKALADLNVYADSLRSRYTAEMVKLEASLAEMERELTRAEAAHMRERRELLDREAVAMADGQRFLNRTILLQGEVVKMRARETDLRRENARLLETSLSTATEGDAAAADIDAVGAQRDATEVPPIGNDEAASLRQDNAELRARIESLLKKPPTANRLQPPVAGTESGLRRERGKSENDREESGSASTSLASSSGLRSWGKGTGGILQAGRRSLLPSFTTAPPVEDSVAGKVPGAGPPSGGEVLDAIVNEKTDQSAQTEQSSTDATEDGSRVQSDRSSAEATVTDVSKTAGFSGDDEARRAFQEAGVARVVEGLRDENARLRKRLRAAEYATDLGESRASEEAARGDQLELELGRVRITVKGKVNALKAALEEAEGDAERAQLEKEEFVAQWEEDVDALRQQLVKERERREDDRRDMEGVIFELEDEVAELKERFRRRKNSRGMAKKRKGSDKLRNPSRDPSNGIVEVEEDDAGRQEAERKNKNPSRERSQKESADEQWNKAMTLLQYLD